MYKISSRTGRTGGRNRMRTAGMCSVCFSQANVPFNLCPRIGFVFLEAPKKQKHNPYALLLDLLFWQPQKTKNKTLVPSYCICFFWKPQKSKKNWCPRIGCAFSKATKKKKHNPYAKHKHNPCALVLDLLFWQPRKTKTASTTRST